jgi:hypothetical protein
MAFLSFTFQYNRLQSITKNIRVRSSLYAAILPRIPIGFQILHGTKLSQKLRASPPAHEIRIAQICVRASNCFQAGRPHEAVNHYIAAWTACVVVTLP